MKPDMTKKEIKYRKVRYSNNCSKGLGEDFELKVDINIKQNGLIWSIFYSLFQNRKANIITNK